MKRLMTVSLMSDAGCHVELLNLHHRILELPGKVSLVYSQILMDEKELPRSVDIALVEGAVRTDHDQETLRKVREASGLVVAFGSCACLGGVPSLINPTPIQEALKSVYLETASTVGGVIPYKDVPKPLEFVLPISEVVKVDYMIPGCPPESDEIFATVTSLLEGEEPHLTEKHVCDECDLERRGVFEARLKRVHERPEPGRCLLEQGYLCLGPATRGGCKARCPGRMVPCDGCRGPSDTSWDQGLAMLDAVSATAHERIGTYELRTHAGIFHRYTYGASALSRLQRRLKK
ncbi:MAG: F420-nonreducing hydrogenase [Candidatus Bathyarchaeia archaeon]